MPVLLFISRSSIIACYASKIFKLIYSFYSEHIFSFIVQVTVVFLYTSPRIITVGIFAGLMWPTEGIHYMLRSISVYMPLTMSTESLRSLTAKGLGLEHPSVYLGFVSIFSWILIFSLASFIMLKLKRDVWTKS